MPYCRICGKRIELSTTGVKVYKCRLCGKVVCRDDFDIVRNLCINCAGIKARKPMAARTR